MTLSPLDDFPPDFSAAGIDLVVAAAASTRRRLPERQNPSLRQALADWLADFRVECVKNGLYTRVYRLSPSKSTSPAVATPQTGDGFFWKTVHRAPDFAPFRGRRGAAFAHPARHELAIALAALDAGLSVAGPLFALAPRPGGHQDRNFTPGAVISRAAAGEKAETLLPRLAAADPIAAHALTGDLGALAARWHAAGFVHRDFYLGHVFVSEPAGTSPAGSNGVIDDGRPRLTLIDLLRAERRPSLSRRDRARDLSALTASFCEVPIGEALFETLRARYDAAARPPRGTWTLARLRARRIRRHLDLRR